VSGRFVYVADDYYNVVRRVDTTTESEIVVAGNGTQGFSGDGGRAISAQLYLGRSASPDMQAGVAVDTAGNLFIADSGNNRICKVEAFTTTCVGDCDGNGSVTVYEILTLINVALGNAEPSACPHGVLRGSRIDIASILTAVNNALGGCPLTPK
jgi:DNA-binding beta-propeller fold protein YncE